MRKKKIKKKKNVYNNWSDPKGSPIESLREYAKILKNSTGFDVFYIEQERFIKKFEKLYQLWLEGQNK